MYYYFIDTKDGALVFQREATEKEFEELKKTYLQNFRYAKR